MYRYARLVELDLGVLTGVTPPTALVAWADEEISRSETPATELFDISLGSRLPPHELERLAAPIVARAPEEELLRGRAQWASNALAWIGTDEERALQFTQRLSRLGGSLQFPWAEFPELYWLEDAFEEMHRPRRWFRQFRTPHPAMAELTGFLARVAQGRRHPDASRDAG